jgi:hypothetical protein
MLALASCSQSRSTFIEVGSQAAAPLLVRGFYPSEGDYRWTKTSFAVQLHPPAKQRGMRLTLELFIAPELIARNRDTTLACKVDDVELAPQTYSATGSQKLERETPPILKDPALLECSTSKAFVPGGADTRELGIVLSKIRMQPL